MMELKEGQYIVGMWYFDFPDMGNGYGDWTAVVARDKNAPANTWRLQYRFRYYRTSGPFEGKDEFSPYTGTLHGVSEEDVVRKVGAAANEMHKLAGGVGIIDFLRVGGGLDKLFDIIMSDECPKWLHAQRTCAA